MRLTNIKLLLFILMSIKIPLVSAQQISSDSSAISSVNYTPKGSESSYEKNRASDANAKQFEINYKVTGNTGNNSKDEFQLSMTVNRSEKQDLANAFSDYQKALNDLRANAAQESTKVRPWAALGQTMRQFPLEFVGFQAGLGFMALVEMTFRYHNNPLAFQQALETLTLENSMGAFSFFAFMYASRLSMPVWIKLIQSPQIRAYFPMFMGMLASNFSHMYLEPLLPCAKDVINRLDPAHSVNRVELDRGTPKSCSQAYDELVMNGNFAQMAPMLISGLLSMPVSSAIQSTFRSLAEIAKKEPITEMVKDNNGNSKKVFNKAGQSFFSKEFRASWNKITYFIPGFGNLKIIKAVADKLAHTAVGAVVFVGIADTLIVYPIVNKGWVALVDGPQMRDTSKQMESDLWNLKLKQWSDQEILNSQDSESVCIKNEHTGSLECFYGFPAKMHHFRKLMTQWRQKHMESAQMSHQAWNMKFSKMTSAYEGAYHTYNRVLTDILTFQKQKEQGLDTSMQHADQYFGVKPLEYKAMDMFSLEGFRSETEENRKSYIQDWRNSAQKIKKDLAAYREKEKNNVLPRELQTLELISSYWNPREAAENIKQIKAFLEGKPQSLGVRVENLKSICKDQFRMNEQIFRKLVNKPVAQRTSTETLKIKECYEHWVTKETMSFLEGTKLYSKLINEKNGFKSLPSSSQFIIYNIKKSMSAATAHLVDWQEVKLFTPDQFLDAPDAAKLLQVERVKKTARWIKDEISSLQKNGQRMNADLKKIEKVGDLLDLTEESSMETTINDLLSGTLKPGKIPLLRRALHRFGSDNLPILGRLNGQISQAEFDRILDSLLENNIKEIIESRSYWRAQKEAKTIKGLDELFVLMKPKSVHQDSAAGRLVAKLKENIGFVRPIKEKGRAYMKNFEVHSMYTRYYDMIDYPKKPGRYPLETPAEYFVYQMICGPDPEIGESLIKKSFIGYDTFIPPKIRSIDHSMNHFCNSSYFDAFAGASNKTMYTDAFQVLTTKGEKKSYTGVLEYLADNIRTRVLDFNTMSNNLSLWWDSEVSPQLNTFFNSYSKDYVEVIKSLEQSLTKSGDLHGSNPISESPIMSLKQEAKFYLTILNEMMNDLGKQKNIASTYPEQNLSHRQRVYPEAPLMDHFPDGRRSLFKALRLSPQVFDLEALASETANTTEKKLNGVALPIMKYDQSLTEITDLFFKPSNQNISKLSKVYEDSLNKFEVLFQEIESLTAPEHWQGLTIQQREIITQCLKGLKDIQMELRGYQLFVTLLNYKTPSFGE